MCLIAFSLAPETEYPLIVIANRDEFLNRPTQPARYWEKHPSLLAGMDLEAGGTWMGITRQGRFAAVTNYRDPTSPAGPLSRGELVTRFLTSTETAAKFIANSYTTNQLYSGYNLIAGSPNELYYHSNKLQSPTLKPLPAGTYGLSNHILNTPWPKVTETAQALEEWKAQPPDSRRVEALFAILGATQQAADEDLPETGISYEKEKALSARFIDLPHYATRSSAVLLVDHRQNVQFFERTYRRAALDSNATDGSYATQACYTTRQFEFSITQERETN